MNKIIKYFISLIYIIQFIICSNDNTIKLKILNNNTYFKSFDCVISNETIEKKNNIYNNNKEIKTYFHLNGFISLNISHIFVPDLAEIEKNYTNPEEGYNSLGIDENLKTQYKASKDLYLENNYFEVNSSYYILQKFIFNLDKDKELKLEFNFVSLANNIFNNHFQDEFNDTYNYAIFGLNYIPNDYDENNEQPYSFFSLLKNIEKSIYINKTGDETDLIIGKINNKKDNSNNNNHILVSYNPKLYSELGWSSYIQYLIFDEFNKSDMENFTNVSIPLNENNNSVLFNYNNYQNFHIFPYKYYFDNFKEKYFFDKLNDSKCSIIEEYLDKNDNNYTIFKCDVNFTFPIFGFIINGTFINLTERAFFKFENGTKTEYIFKIFFSNDTNYIYFDLNHFLDEDCKINLKVESVNFNYIPKIIIEGDFLEDVSKVSPIIKDEKLSLKGIYKLIFLGVVMFILVVLLVIRHWLQIKGKNEEENNNENNNLIEQ